MNQDNKKLRMIFEAETNIILGTSTYNWEKYALWLEELSIMNLNLYFKNKVHQVIESLS